MVPEVEMAEENGEKVDAKQEIERLREENEELKLLIEENRNKNKFKKPSFQNKNDEEPNLSQRTPNKSQADEWRDAENEDFPSDE